MSYTHNLSGPQPAVPTLGALENQTRFMTVFIAFLGSLASKNNPLVFFIDDLQCKLTILL